MTMPPLDNVSERARFASCFPGRYHGHLMPQPLRKLCLALLVVLLFAGSRPARATDAPATFPLSDVKPGMKGVAYTIFEGDQVEKVDLEVIGVLHNAVGPKLDIILVRLLGDKVQQTGVVAGMSGSPVYFDGKLAGALSLKLGNFTKEAIGGVTPIDDMLEVEQAPAPATTVSAGLSAAASPSPDEFAERTAVGSGQFLVPIETPLITAGLYPETLARFGKDFSSWGMATMAGGSAAPSPDDAKLKPGDMVGIDLMRGDLSISSGCTVTTVVGESHSRLRPSAVWLWLRSNAALPRARDDDARFRRSLNQNYQHGRDDRHAHARPPNGGDGHAGRRAADDSARRDADTPAEQKKYHFEVVESPQLTPMLVARAAYNGIVGSPAYGEGSTLQLDGTIDMKGHTSVQLDDLFAPTDQPTPAAFYVATEVHGRLRADLFESVRAAADRANRPAREIARRAALGHDRQRVDREERSAARRDGRGESAAAALSRRALHSGNSRHDSGANRARHASTRRQRRRFSEPQRAIPGGHFAGTASRAGRADPADQSRAPQRPSLRHPASVHAHDARRRQGNAECARLGNQRLDQRQNPGNARLLLQSTAGEWSVEMHQVIAGQHMLTITVK